MTHRRPKALTALGTGLTIGDSCLSSGLRSDFLAKSDEVPSPAILGLSEREFQRIVIAGLEQRGYLVTTIPDMRKTRAGWPDLFFFHPRLPGLAFAWELKAEKGRLRQKQLETLIALNSVPGIDACVVRPSDWWRWTREERE